MREVPPWPFRWFGLWAPNRALGSDPYRSDDPTKYPPIADWIDPDWSPDDRGAILDYLRDSPPIHITSQGKRACSLCKLKHDETAWFSDGTWSWPESLAHDVQSHAVRLPNEMIEHIRSMDCFPPTRLGRDAYYPNWPDATLQSEIQRVLRVVRERWRGSP